MSVCVRLFICTPPDPEATENQRMISAAFVGQAWGDIRRDLQKLEEFAGMNTSQLLEVASKVFINQDPRKMDLLAADLAGQSSGP
jgi:hypothetical protein